MSQEEKITITLGEISTLVQIIDVVSQRGAIQGSEMQGVGSLRNKLEAFLKQNGAEQPAAAAQDADVETVEAPKGPLQGKVV